MSHEGSTLAAMSATNNQKTIVDISDIKDAVREAVKSKSLVFYNLSKKPEFDALLMAVMEYFKRFLKSYHSKNESSWLVQKFKSRVSQLQGGIFSNSMINVEDIDIAYRSLGTKYSMWLVSSGHGANSHEELKLFNALILFFNMILKKIFTNRGDSSLIEMEVDRLFNARIARSRKSNKNNISGLYKSHSPLIALLYPNSQEQSQPKTFSRPADAGKDAQAKFADSDQIHLEFKDYENMDIIMGVSKIKRRRNEVV